MRNDRGKVALYTIILANAWFVMLAMVIVGGGRMRAFQRADNIAAEAARIAGSEIEIGQAIDGGSKEVHLNNAILVGEQYIREAGATGDVAVALDRTHLIVTVTLKYNNPSGLEFLGGGEWEANGRATATLLVG